MAGADDDAPAFDARSGAPSSRKRLTFGAIDNFDDSTLFGRIARAVCVADCLPRKELFEAWEVARRVRRRHKGGRVIDMACGHGLLALCMLLIDERSTEAIAVDTRLPASHMKVHDALCARWPQLQGRVRYVQGRLQDVALRDDDVVVSAHACGPLTDAVLDAALQARCAVGVLPCCHRENPHHPLAGWIDPALAIDVERAERLRAAGYAVRTQRIPASITPKNRLLIGTPPRFVAP